MTNVNQTLNDAGSAPSAEPITPNPVVDQTPAAENPAPATQAQAPQDAKPTTAEPSAAELKDANKKRTLHDVIRDAHKDADAAEPSSAKDPKDTASTADSESKPDDGKTPEDKAREAEEQRLDKIPRFRELLSKSKELEAKVSRYEAELAPKARQMDEIHSFMREKNLAAEEVAQGLNVMDAIKNNPKQAVEWLEPLLNQLKVNAGIALPPELAQRVEDGITNPEDAKELARIRAERATLQRQQEEYQRTVRFQQEAAQREQEQARQTAIDSALSQVASTFARDPDWSRKQRYIANAYALEASQNTPRTPEEAVALAHKVKAIVDQDFAQMSGRTAPVTRSPASAASSNTAVRKPASIHDIVRMGMSGQLNP